MGGCDNTSMILGPVRGCKLTLNILRIIKSKMLVETTIFELLPEKELFEIIMDKKLI